MVTSSIEPARLVLASAMNRCMLLGVPNELDNAEYFQTGPLEMPPPAMAIRSRPRVARRWVSYGALPVKLKSVRRESTPEGSVICHISAPLVLHDWSRMSASPLLGIAME